MTRILKTAKRIAREAKYAAMYADYCKLVANPENDKMAVMALLTKKHGISQNSIYIYLRKRAKKALTMVQMVTLTAGEIHAIAIQLYKEIEGSHYQHISAGISAKTTELSVSAIYDGAEVFIEDYKCLDEDCNSLSIVESDLEKIEEIINQKIV